MRVALVIVAGLACAVAAAPGAAAPEAAADTSAAFTMEDCFRKDSIACVQMVAYRKIKSFFEQDSVPLVSGLSLVREAASETEAASGARELGRRVEAAEDVQSREEALEEFAVGEAAAFIRERSLRLDLSQLVRTGARAIADNLPSDVRKKVTEVMTEGRGKKKILKTLIPILIAIKLKVVGAVALTILTLLLLAKKALLTSLLALAISGFLAIRKLLSQNQHPAYEVHEAHPAVGGAYSSGYPAGGGVAYESTGYSHGEYGAHSAPIAAHSLAYSAHKPARR